MSKAKPRGKASLNFSRRNRTPQRVGQDALPRPIRDEKGGRPNEKGELDSDQEYNERVAEVASPTIIDLDEWIISPTQPEPLCEVTDSEGQPESSETAPPFALTPPAVLFTKSTLSNTTSETQLTFAFE